jgi:hypothetical protein
LRGLPRSPPHLAGQASAPLRATRFNPCRKRPKAYLHFFYLIGLTPTLCQCKTAKKAKTTHLWFGLPGPA